MAKSDKTIKQLQAEIDTDLSKFIKRYVVELKATTPIRTGRARNGWVNTWDGKKLGNGGKINVAKNNVPYIGVLDTGSSKQAPRGIVQPALKQTRKK